MDTNDILEIAREAIWVMLKISAPVLFVSLLIGLAISLFQALTQIQEVTLTFVPKLISIFATLLIFLPFMIETLKVFTEHLAEKIVSGP